MANIDSDLISGNIDTIILKTMLNEDKYGLDIIKEVENKSNGTYELKQPTLYSCLKRLENQELISSYWVDSDIGGRRHYYKLTDKGRDFYNKKQEEWSKSKFIIDNLLSNFNNEEYRLIKKDEYDKILEQKEENLNASKTLNNEQSDEIQEIDATDLENEENDEYVEVQESDENLDSDKLIDVFDESTEEVDNSIDVINESVNESDDVQTNEDFEFDEDNNSELDLNESSEDEKFTPENNEPEDSNLSYQNLDNPYDDFNSDESEDNYNDYDQDEFSNQSENENVGMEINYYNLKDNNEELSEINNQTDDNVYENSHEDYSEAEENFLSSLRAVDEEEINEYYGDKQTYANQNIQSNDYNLTQSSFDFDENENGIDKKLNEFNENISKLNNFNFSSSQNDEDDNDSFEDVEVNEENDTTQDIDNKDSDDIMNELDSLGNDNLSSFANSNDFDDYDKISNGYQSQKNSNNTLLNQSFEYDTQYQNENYFENDNNQSDLEFENVQTSQFDVNNYNDDTETTKLDNENDLYNLSEYDKIISNNLNSESNETKNDFKYFDNQTNYKQKLSSLSQYSQMSINDTKQSDKGKFEIEKIDFDELKSNLSEEGITIKEFAKINTNDNSEKNYLLVNKINLVRSLIIFFGYVFILSSVYIVLNNTAFRNIVDFSFKYFAYGFIPFGIILLYRLIVYIIDPYKKGPAKVPTRILLFISFIITIQLLLITYCVNLQLGFYSFVQLNYNHLLWLIPTIISFAPLVSTSVYMILFYSQNFNV